MQKQFLVKEVFYSLQGEGVRAGTPAIFVRFAGCNQQCRKETHGFDCDTDWKNGERLTAEQILAEVQRVGAICNTIIFTGGEPGLQLTKELTDFFHGEGYALAVETNGTIDLSGLGIDWITVSPKVPDHLVRQRTASEVKFVVAAGQDFPKTEIQADHYLLSPAFKGAELDRESVDWCIKLIKECPLWRLSVQVHKLLNMP